MAELGRILIADDEETFLFSTADLLREEGYECECASDSKTVIEMVKASRYDVLITDINMPGNSELELLKDISKVDKRDGGHIGDRLSFRKFSNSIDTTACGGLHGQAS